VLIHHAAKGTELSTIREISDKHRISENHLMKVVNRLAGLGYVATLRGKGGGLRLARAPEKINVAEVVRNTEETLSVVECLVNEYAGACALSPSCRLKSALRDAQAAFFDELARYTLKDLVPKRSGAPAVRFYKTAGALQPS
jgi:Rrf2 family nitric oxide-sensitive transcriptional repressor